MNKEVQNSEIKTLLTGSFLKEFLEDENITDISYNGTDLRIQDNIRGRYKPDKQPTEEEVSNLVRRIGNIQGKEITDSSPILDTEIDYLRVNAMHKSVSPFGTTMAVRVSKPKKAIANLDDLATKDIASLLDVLIKGDTNVIISGETGSGKTELQKLLVGFINDDKKITLIEDTMDSHLKSLYPNKDINSWRTLAGQREKPITEHELIKSGLRNNPDWMIISETRGGEAYDMLESALTDHAIITTLHATSAKAIVSRLIKMIGKQYQINEHLLGKDIITQLRFGIHMQMEYTDQGIRRFIKEIVEFVDYTEHGAIYNMIYERKKEYNEKNNSYEIKHNIGTLSSVTKGYLTDLELFHLIPDCFK